MCLDTAVSAFSLALPLSTPFARMMGQGEKRRPGHLCARSCTDTSRAAGVRLLLWHAR